MQRISILNGEKNLWQDYDISNLTKGVISDGVIEGLTLSKDGDDVKISVGKSLVKVTRDGTPSQEFYSLFENTEELTITGGDDKKIFIEINQDNINDASLNTNADGTGIGEIKIEDDFPTKNFIKLGTQNGSGDIVLDDRQEIVLNSSVLDKANFTGITGDITTTGDVTANKFKGDGSELTGLTAQVESASLSKMLGEDGVVGSAYSLVDYEQTTGGTDNKFGQDDQPYSAQQFFGQGHINDMIFNIKKVGSDRNDIFLEIQGDDAGNPDGDALATSDTVAKADVDDTYKEITFTNLDFTPVEGLKYHAVLKASGIDVNDYFQAESANANKQIGTLLTYNGSDWTAQDDDLYFKFSGYKLAMKGGNNFIGICQTTGNAGEIKVFNTGYDKNQSGLTIGDYYGYNESTGEIDGIGNFVAISETELDLKKDGNFIGEIKIWTSDNIPQQFIICDGSEISRKDYSGLFSVIGETYGNGDGSDTFNIPDLRGNVPVGKDGGTFKDLGDVGGEETHKLTIDEMPSHSHQSLSDDSGNSSGLDVRSNMKMRNGHIGNTGGDSEHNNLQPYLTINYIIKY